MLPVSAAGDLLLPKQSKSAMRGPSRRKTKSRSLLSRWGMDGLRKIITPSRTIGAVMGGDGLRLEAGQSRMFLHDPVVQIVALQLRELRGEKPAISVDIGLVRFDTSLVRHRRHPDGRPVSFNC